MDRYIPARDRHPLFFYFSIVPFYLLVIGIGLFLCIRSYDGGVGNIVLTAVVALILAAFIAAVVSDAIQRNRTIRYERVVETLFPAWYVVYDAECQKLQALYHHIWSLAQMINDTQISVETRATIRQEHDKLLTEYRSAMAAHIARCDELKNDERLKTFPLYCAPKPRKEYKLHPVSLVT